MTSTAIFAHPAARIVGLGLMWGVAAGAMEAAVLPTSEGSVRSFFVFLAGNCIAWGIVGTGIAWAVDLADWRLERPSFLAMAVLGGSVVFSAVASVVFSLGTVRDLASGQVVPGGGAPLSSFLYQAWIVAFYGGLFAFAWSLGRRALRTRAVLAHAEVARARSETMLARAQLRALRGHIDPRFLLRVMREVERRYAADCAPADRLVVRLVSFLRAAMPGVRSESSTLAAEVALARAYATLCAELDALHPAWTFDVTAPCDDVAFPPLLLLPIVDGLSTGVGGARQGRLAVTRDDREVHVELDIDGAPASDELARTACAALDAIYGDGWSLRTRKDRTGPALCLSLPLSREGVPG